jgi:8-oxo-dGTP diphosphatase
MADALPGFCYTALLVRYGILARRLMISMSISMVWKKRIARLIRWPLLQQLMVGGIMLTVPKRRVGVNLVPLNSAGQVLLLRHVFHPQVPWGLPGGWLGRGEAPAAGALREFREETGLTAVLGPVLLVEQGRQPSHLGIAFLGYVQPAPLTLSNEILAADWFPPDDLPPLQSFVRQAIETAVAYHSPSSPLTPAARSAGPTQPAEDKTP